MVARIPPDSHNAFAVEYGHGGAEEIISTVDPDSGVRHAVERYRRRLDKAIKRADIALNPNLTAAQRTAKLIRTLPGVK